MNFGFLRNQSKNKQIHKSELAVRTMSALIIVCSLTWMGCSAQRKQASQFSPDYSPCSDVLQRIEYPDLTDECDTDGSDLMAGPPMTISSFQETVPWELTVEECVELALANSKVMQKLGGVVLNSPVGATTLYDQALAETNPQSVEAALSAFDAQVNTSFSYNRNERVFNNLFFGGGVANAVNNTSSTSFELAKTTTSGARIALRNQIDYNRNNSPVNRFASTYDVVNLMELRQPLLRGRGAMVNRIAGPNAQPGVYNGVLISRIRSDISLTDFESAVRNLVRDVENNYWELYFAYRDLDTKMAARESSRETWENRKLRYENGVGRPDDEAQARQQYFNFQAQAQNALTGVLNGQPGVLGSERNLRRLMGLNSSDGRVVRPISEPAVAPVVFDWEQSQIQALGRRVEIRRQKWTLRQRELELLAAKSLNKWRLDLVGQYGFRGFGDNLFGSRSRAQGSAYDDLINGDLDDWQVGVELGGAIGNRTGHLAIRNAELNLVREKAVLKEQQRQILHDLNAAFTEVDRSMANLRTSFNSRVAVQEELDPKRKRVSEGQDQVFFLLDAEQRAATAESAVHRAVADYNQALLNYAFTSGSLLSRFNIRLTEGEWSEDAQCNANRKAPRYERRGPNDCDIDTRPVSYGGFNQSAPMLGGVSGSGFSSPADAYYPEAGAGAEFESNQDGDSSVIPMEGSREIEPLRTPVPDGPDEDTSAVDFDAPASFAKRYLDERFKR